MVERSIVIDIEGLTKHFYQGFWRKRVQVLNGVDLQVYQGETFGLLGPNGAGKTTTLKAIVGLIKPTDGHVKILGKSPWDPRIRQYLGYLPEQAYVYGYLTGYEFLELCGKFFRVSPRQLKARIPELLELVKLTEKDSRKQVRTYSKGMTQRLAFAQALINDPQLLLLDEPMSGLDPLGRYDVKELILNLKDQGKTILFNTHILSDVEAICDRMGIMVDGRLVLSGSMQQLHRPMENIYQMRVQRLDKLGLTNLKRLSLRCVTAERGQTEATFNNLDQALKAMQVIRQSGAELLELKTHHQNLEDLFVKEVEKARKDVKP